jgi:hypothetical protein
MNYDFIFLLLYVKILVYKNGMDQVYKYLYTA